MKTNGDPGHSEVRVDVLWHEGETGGAPSEYRAELRRLRRHREQDPGAGLRLGWLVVPARLADRVTAEHAVTYAQPSVIAQSVFAILLERGEIDRHLRKARSTYRARRAVQRSHPALTRSRHGVVRALQEQEKCSERSHLFRVAGHSEPGPGTIDRRISPSIQRLLGRLTHVPVVVIDAAGELQASNPLASALIGDLSGPRGGSVGPVRKSRRNSQTR